MRAGNLFCYFQRQCIVRFGWVNSQNRNLVVLSGPRARLRTLPQAGRGASPWSTKERFRMLGWRLAWALLCRPTPKPFYAWRNLVLKAFGARVSGRPLIASSATIQIPWHVELEDRSCVGEKAVLYSQGRIVLRKRCTVAQECYLSAGTHDFSDPQLPLVTGEIVIGEEAFIGARAFVHAGVHVGAGAVIGACSVVTKDVTEWTIAAGNPCAPIRRRVFGNREDR